MSPQYPRCTFLPPQGRPRWMPDDPDGWDLLYLSWGMRWFGDNPIPQAMHEGWVYIVVMEGTPHLRIKQTTRHLKPGSVLVIDPDCPYGWKDEPGASCRILNWVWRTPPTHSAVAPRAGGFVELHTDTATRNHLAAIQISCQKEVGMPGELAFLVLRRARLDLDITLARLLSRNDAANSAYRFNLAIQFLRHNPCAQDPVRSLCEYLQISSSTLKLLFHKHCGVSPQAYALRCRMELARERLANGSSSVKEIAYELGYHHPNDFSRAFRRCFGMTAREFLGGEHRDKASDEDEAK